jgi:two-component system, sensor histidine kinase and response regulator
MKSSEQINSRVLVIESDPAIHQIFCATLAQAAETALHEVQTDKTAFGTERHSFTMDCANRWQTAIAMIQTALRDRRPYAMVFVSSEGHDIETIQHIWESDPEIQIVLCMAYSKDAWASILRRVGCNDNLIVIRRPVDAIEIWQLANVLAQKWRLTHETKQQRNPISNLVDQQVAELKRANECLQYDLDRHKQTESKLQDALHHAIATLNAKADFLSMMSHEIRSPLTGVMGMAELLVETELTDEQRECVDTIHSSGGALLSIINDVLDFSKIEAGKLTLDPIDFDLRTTVEEVVKLLAAKAHKKELEIACLMPADLPPTLRGDPGRLRQILINLIDNAIKFTPQGDVLVRATLGEESPDSIILRFEIIDSGIGLSSEDRAKLFQPFSQADCSISRKYGGTGLGLAICKRLVELMDGQIGIESEVGRGSTFWFTVRLAKQPAEAAKELPIRADLQGLRAFVVARNATMHRVLEHYLSHWGVQVASANDGSTAWAFLKAAAARGEACDLALLDMPISNMDAFDLARAVKVDPLLAHTRLVMLTSLGHRGQAREAQEAGFSAYLTKPVRHAQLYRCLVTVMGASSVAGNNQGVDGVSSSTKTPLVTKYTLKEAEARKRSRILIVDDSVVDQKVAAKMLEKLGYQADIAATGRNALEILADSRAPYAAVLMDWKMPGMNGLEVTAEIRRRKGMVRNTAIIAMTIKSAAGDREQCLTAGMDEYISKPLSLDQLDTVLRRCTSKTFGQDVGSKQSSQEAGRKGGVKSKTNRNQKPSQKKPVDIQSR